MIVNLICTNPECEGFEFVVPFPDPEELCICGGCGHEITRKEPVE